MKQHLFCILFLLFLSTNIILAGGSDGKMNATKGASIGHDIPALPLGPGALYHNPGSVAFLVGKQISFGGGWLQQNNQLRPNYSDQEYDLQSTQIPYFAYATIALKNRKTALPNGLSFGIGVYTPYFFEANYPETWEGRYILQQSRLHTTYIQPTISYQIHKRLGIGLGYVHGRNRFSFQQGLPLQTATQADGQIQLDGRGKGHGANFGFYLLPTDRISIGFVYHSALQFVMKEGTVNYDVPATFLPDYTATDFFARIQMPDHISIGIAWHFSNHHLQGQTYRSPCLTFNISRVRWTEFRQIEIRFNEPMGGTHDLKLDRYFSDTYQLSLGGQYALIEESAPGIILRGGIQLENYAVPADRFTPEQLDASQWGGNLGFTLRFSHHIDLDIAARYRQQSIRDIQNNAAAFGGVYNGDEWLLSVGLAWTFL